MRPGFLILRDNYYKNLGPTIDECLKRNYNAVLFLDETMFGKSIKKSPAPTLKSVPKFIHGEPQIVTYKGVNSFSDEAISHVDVIIVFCLSTTVPQYANIPENTYQYQLSILRKKGIPVVSIYSHFYDSCLIDLENYESVDIFCAISQYSLDAYKEILFKCSSLKGKELEKYGNHIDNVFEEKVRITGSALFDSLLNIYNKRNKQDTKCNDIIFFLPKIFNQPFMKLMFRNRSKLFSFIESLLLYKGSYLSEIIKEPNYFKFIKCLDKILNKDQLELICKSRPKHTNAFENKLKKMSKMYYSGIDDNFYPGFTSHEILIQALFCIHIRTFSVLESVIAGVPSIHFQVPILYKKNKVRKMESAYVETVRSAKENTLFNFDGCVWNVAWEDSLDFIENTNLKDIVQDSDQRSKYIKEFCGICDLTAAEKEVNAIESLF